MAYYCDVCHRYFVSEPALRQHKNASSRHDWCDKCDREFDTYESLRKHWINSSNHNFCSFCNEDFDYDDQLREHDNASHEYCSSCDLWLDTTEEMQGHDIAEHNLCVQCNRYFSSPNALKNHLNSSKHVEKTVSCPGLGCNKKFSSATNLILHFETGTCVSGVTRQHVNNMVTQLDRTNLITNPRRMITGTTESYQATEHAWNGYNYECYLCHKEFGSLNSLNQHLASPIHEQPIYHCPTLGTGCRLQFRTLGQLFQHVENGSCGAGRFKLVQEGMQRITQGMRRIGFR
ncbi:hypothetical protein FRC12_008501 [Ceratobasidium sp. 428]|nr:hypothetical protein FRC12_008501 [Ceratobasidium sp. 428]